MKHEQVRPDWNALFHFCFAPIHVVGMTLVDTLGATPVPSLVPGQVVIKDCALELLLAKGVLHCNFLFVFHSSAMIHSGQGKPY